MHIPNSFKKGKQGNHLPTVIDRHQVGDQHKWICQHTGKKLNMKERKKEIDKQSLVKPVQNTIGCYFKPQKCHSPQWQPENSSSFHSYDSSTTNKSTPFHYPITREAILTTTCNFSSVWAC